MRMFIFFIVLFITGKCFCQEKLQLAPPLLKYNSVFFKDTILVSLLFAQEDATIRYTTNGKLPLQTDAVYTQPIMVTKTNTIITAKAFSDNYITSDAVSATFIKDGIPVEKISFPQTHENYKGSGLNTLSDNKGGFTSYTSNTWLGFNNDSVTFSIHLSKPTAVKKVLFNVLQDYGSWIFFPEKAILFTADKKTGKLTEAGVLNFIPEQGKDISVCKPAVIKINRAIKTNHLQLKLYLLKKIPAWHSGSGQKSWIFIDEIKLY